MAFAPTTHSAASVTFFDRIANVFENVQKTREDRKLYRKTVKELRGLSDRDLSDLGLNRSMIVAVAREAVYK